MSKLINNYARYNIAFVKGSGSRLYDESGAEYLDFGCGISVTNLGHAHPHVTQAISQQARTLIHTSNLYENRLQEKLADRLSAASFGGELFFCNSGAEANEAAIKLARIYGNKKYNGKKQRIIVMNNGFHGRTFATLSATAQHKIQAGFEPVASFFTTVEINDIKAVEAEIAKGDVIAVMLELYQGESGVLPADKGYVKKLRELTTKNEVLLIIDEVQTGYGRTGKMFAYQKYDIVPDIMTLAKGIANGFPMGAIVAKPEVAAYFTYGTHGSTFGGTFLACAAAHAVLDVMLADTFLDAVANKGGYAMDKLKEVTTPYGCTVRGDGLLIGIQIPHDVKDFVTRALANKLILVPAGNSSVRFYPPLNATKAEIDEGIDKVKATLDSYK